MNPVAAAGFALQAVGLLFHIIGFATPNWSEGDHFYGLWQFCFNDYGEPRHCRTYTSGKREQFQGKLEAAEALATIGLVAAIVAVAAGFLYNLLPMLGRQVTSTLRYVTGGNAMFASLVILICVLLWVGGVPQAIDFNELGYSFCLSLIGGIFLFLGGFVIMFSGSSLSQAYTPIAGTSVLANVRLGIALSSNVTQ